MHCEKVERMGFFKSTVYCILERNLVLHTLQERQRGGEGG